MLVAEQALQAVDPARKVALMAALGRKIGGPWRDARGDAPVIRLIESSLADPASRVAGIALARGQLRRPIRPDPDGLRQGREGPRGGPARRRRGRRPDPAAGDRRVHRRPDRRGQGRAARPRSPRPPSGPCPTSATPTRSSWR